MVNNNVRSLVIEMTTLNNKLVRDVIDHILNSNARNIRINGDINFEKLVIRSAVDHLKSIIGKNDDVTLAISRASIARGDHELLRIFELPMISSIDTRDRATCEPKYKILMLDFDVFKNVFIDMTGSKYYEIESLHVFDSYGLSFTFKIRSFEYKPIDFFIDNFNCTDFDVISDSKYHVDFKFVSKFNTFNTSLRMIDDLLVINVSDIDTKCGMPLYRYDGDQEFTRLKKYIKNIPTIEVDINGLIMTISETFYYLMLRQIFFVTKNKMIKKLLEILIERVNARISSVKNAIKYYLSNPLRVGYSKSCEIFPLVTTGIINGSTANKIVKYFSSINDRNKRESKYKIYIKQPIFKDKNIYRERFFLNELLFGVAAFFYDPPKLTNKYIHNIGLTAFNEKLPKIDIISFKDEFSEFDDIIMAFLLRPNEVHGFQDGLEALNDIKHVLDNITPDKSRHHSLLRYILTYNIDVDDISVRKKLFSEFLKNGFVTRNVRGRKRLILSDTFDNSSCKVSTFCECDLYIECAHDIDYIIKHDKPLESIRKESIVILKRFLEAHETKHLSTRLLGKPFVGTTDR